MSLGATRWQTAVRIVLPAAGSGIISAVLLGFSRAVGETMIILFVSGNVPAMDWSVFSGFRALSASVALETPNVIRETVYTGYCFSPRFSCSSRHLR